MGVNQMKTMGVAVAVLVALGTLGACSDDGGSGDAATSTVEPFSPETLEPDDYEQRATQLCEETVAGEGGGLPTTPEGLEAEQERLSVAYEELSQLPPPEGQEDAVQAFFDQADLVLVKLEELARARADGDDALAEEIEGEFDDAVEELQRLGDEVGLGACTP